jgi:segregation and condensation protein A
MPIGRHDRTPSARRASVRAAGRGNLDGVPVLDASAALTQEVEIDLFQGPFDLLLTLLLRDEVDMLELPLADLIEDAVTPGHDEHWEIDAASQLILLLASIADLKGRRMLGEEADEEPDPDAVAMRDALVARLVAYAPFQRAAQWLAERLRAAQGPRYRRVPPGTAAPVAVRDDPARLRAAMDAMVEAPPAPSLTHMGVQRRPLPELLGRLRESIARLRDVSFDAMVADCDRLEEALTLLAALELVRRGEAEMRQDVPFGDITITGMRGVRA